MLKKVELEETFLFPPAFLLNMFAAQTELPYAEKVKKALLKNNLIHPDYLLVKEFGLIYFPLIKKAAVPLAKTVEVKFSFPKKQQAPLLTELLKDKLTAEELKLLPHSQEIVGKILILEIPEELQKKEKAIAKAYLLHNKNITTVVKKEEVHSGTYRTRKVKVLAGKNTKETIHGENGVKLKLDLEKAYFSARTGNERLRIAQQIKKEEIVLVMFSGVAPFPLVIARNSPAKMIYGIEINPAAHQYALKNVALNNFAHKVIIYCGDVREVVPQLIAQIGSKFDRIAMPLPKTGEEFLDVALEAAKKGTIIHLYSFLGEEQFAAERKKIVEICRKLKHPVKVLRTVKCGQFSPYVFRVCFDLRVEK